MPFLWEYLAEEAKKKECQHSISFNPYNLLQGKYHNLQFKNEETKE